MSNTGYALVVDDMPANHAVVQGMLNKYSMSVDCVSSGLEAVELIKEQKIFYDIIFMDHMMPGMDGIETTRLIRQDLGKTSEYARKVPIVALTGNTESKELFFEAGFDEFLCKPVKIIEMAAILSKFIKGLPESGGSSGSTSSSTQTSNDPRGVNPAVNPSVVKLIEQGSKIPGLDIKSALEKINWDYDTCIEVIKSFVKTTPLLLDICKNISPENLPLYCTTVHGIKSVAFSFGAMEVGKMAKELEDKSRAGDMAFVKEKNDEFIKALELLLQNLMPLLQVFSNESSKPKKEKPDPEIIAKILEAAENYNIRNLEQGIALLDEYSYTMEAELIVWLKDKSINSDFTAIY